MGYVVHSQIVIAVGESANSKIKRAPQLEFFIEAIGPFFGKRSNLR